MRRRVPTDLDSSPSSRLGHVQVGVCPGVCPVHGSRLQEVELEPMSSYGPAKLGFFQKG